MCCTPKGFYTRNWVLLASWLNIKTYLKNLMHLRSCYRVQSYPFQEVGIPLSEMPNIFFVAKPQMDVQFDPKDAIIKFTSCCHNSMVGIGFGAIQVMCNSNLSSPLTTTLYNHCHDSHDKFLLVASTLHVDSLPSPMFYEKSKKDHRLFNDCTKFKIAFLLSIL